MNGIREGETDLKRRLYQDYQCLLLIRAEMWQGFVFQIFQETLYKRPSEALFLRPRHDVRALHKHKP